MAVLDNLAPSKSKHVKSASHEWFHIETIETITQRDKLFKNLEIFPVFWSR